MFASQIQHEVATPPNDVQKVWSGLKTPSARGESSGVETHIPVSDARWGSFHMNATLLLVTFTCIPAE